MEEKKSVQTKKHKKQNKLIKNKIKNIKDSPLDNDQEQIDNENSENIDNNEENELEIEEENENEKDSIIDYDNEINKKENNP